jgi:hypothetical protein
MIVEVPKELPSKGNWLYEVAENWIEDQVLYLPDAKYADKYKLTMLKCGAPPDVENWDSHDVFKIVGQFGIYFSFILRDYFHLIGIVLTIVVDFFIRNI